MRGLDSTFLDDLRDGILAPIRQAVINDRDLIMELRHNYINIYFKGQNLAAIRPASAGYATSTHERFLVPGEAAIRDLSSQNDSEKLVEQFSDLKEIVTRYRSSGAEIEFEQMLIRANNYEDRINSEYFLLDRQLVEPGNRVAGRPDLTGIFWSRNGRRRGQQVPLVLFEVKYSLNSDIASLDAQLSSYYEWLLGSFPSIVEQHENILSQKCQLGLFDCQGNNRTDAIGTLKIVPDVTKVQMVIILVDYNPFSGRLNSEKLRQLPFAKQIRIFNVGFALWECGSRNLQEALSEVCEP